MKLAFPDIRVCQAICIPSLFHHISARRIRNFLVTAKSQLTSVTHTVTLSGRTWQSLIGLFGATAWTEATKISLFRQVNKVAAWNATRGSQLTFSSPFLVSEFAILPLAGPETGAIQLLSSSAWMHWLHHPVISSCPPVSSFHPGEVSSGDQISHATKREQQKKNNPGSEQKRWGYILISTLFFRSLSVAPQWKTWW